MKAFLSLCLSIHNMHHLSQELHCNPSASSDLMSPILPQVITGKEPFSLLHNGIFVVVDELKRVTVWPGVS